MPSPLFQEQNKFKSREIVSGVERSDRKKGGADHAPSPLFQEQNKFKPREIISGVERSDRNDGADDRT
jgi:hypothetical protein